ncbi:MAG: TorF family putative porin [Tsuneonella sp.]
MLTSIRGIAAATLFASLFAAAPAFAGDGDETAPDTSPSALTVSGNVALVTDYRFRGVSLSGGDPAVQGGITLTHDSGFYAGTWTSSIDDGGTDVYGDMELDLFAGWSGNVADGIGLDAGLLYYAYPTNAKGADAEYFEPYATISSTLGPVEAKLGVNYAWKQSALGDRDNLSIHSELSSGIPNTPVTLTGHLGYTDGVLAPPLLAGTADDTGFDWSLGASATLLHNLTLGVTYTGVQGPSLDGFTDDTIVGSLSLAF